MCGIFGFSGKIGKKANLKKLKALGVYNIQRGTDSCGYYYSGNIVKGIDKEANWTQFIDSNELIKGVLDGEVFIGHTRKSTSGANTAPNAHPHQIDNYVQTHNGVIKNHWSMCTKYDIDSKTIFVDSIALAHLIKKEGFKILNEYEGTAALAFTYMDDPRSLYLYHGASREKENAQVWEERPLFILKQPEGIYYSSLKESLNFISENKNKAEILPHNIVFKIKDGVLTDYTFIVNREDVNIPKYTVVPTRTTNIGAVGTTKELPFKELSVVKPIKNMALLETYPPEYLKQDVYYMRGRYYRDVNILLNGVYTICRDGIILNGEKTTNRVSETYYFIRGVMINGKKQYLKCLEDVPDIYTNLTQNTAYYLSKYSKYPVIPLEVEASAITSDLRDRWYKDGKMFNGCSNPKFTKRRYTIQSGVLKSISRAFKEDVIYRSNEEEQLTDILDNSNKFTEDEQKLFQDIKDWADVLIKKDDVTLLPEHFLYFLDYYNSQVYTDIVDEPVLEMYTTLLLKDLIKLKMTFFEYLKQHEDLSYMKNEEMLKCFEYYELSEVLKYPNRYSTIDFDSHIEENIEEVVPEIDTIITAEQNKHASQYLQELIEITKNLEKTCDKLQELDTNDDAQNLCFEGYKAQKTLNDAINDAKNKIV